MFMASTALLAACSSIQPVSGSGLRWTPSPNFDERRPNFVIIHQTTNDNSAHALRTLTDPQRKVSAHYLIDRDGTIYQLVDERNRAWHAGASYWGGLTDLNSASIGIELDNTGEEAFPAPQVVVLLGLLSELQQRYQIPPQNFLGHGDVAPRRKQDPGRLFPWKILAEHGFGLWCEASEGALPVSFEPWLALQALGYEVADPAAAIRAYRRHFRQEESDAPLVGGEIAQLNCLVQKKAKPVDQILPIGR